jgi:hypothetical protein
MILALLLLGVCASAWLLILIAYWLGEDRRKNEYL